MQSGINNDVVNNTLERFAPQDWKKLNPNSSTEERKKWISAKYDVLYFSFPDGLNYTALQQQRIGLKLNKNGKRILPKDDATLPVRIADFFLTVGAGECKQFGQDFRIKTYLKVGQQLYMSSFALLEIESIRLFSVVHACELLIRTFPCIK